MMILFFCYLTTRTWLNLTVKDAAEEIKSNEKRVFWQRDIHAERFSKEDEEKWEENAHTGRINCSLIDWFVGRFLRLTNHRKNRLISNNNKFLSFFCFSFLLFFFLDISRGYLICLYTSDNLLIVSVKANAFVQSAHRINMISWYSI